MRISIAGVIVPDDDLRVYNLYGITATAPSSVRQALQDANGADVVVTINSGGGDVFAGDEIYTILREYPGHVLIRIQSMAASAAAIIAMARESEMSPVAQLMIHNVSSGARGDYREMDRASKRLRTANQAIAAAFVAKTGKSEAEILELMDNETWYSAQQAVAEGFVDRIIAPAQTAEKPMQLAASFGSGLLPPRVIEDAKAHLKNTAQAIAEAEYSYLILEGKTK